MSKRLSIKMLLVGCITALTLSACGGSSTADKAGSSSTPASPTNPEPLTPAPGQSDNPTLPGAAGAPLVTGNIAIDGREWLNYRRSLVGLSTLTNNATIGIAAQGHADYQRINNQITHEQTVGKAGFTGVDVSARLSAAGYRFNTSASRAYGEVISATSNGDGQYMAEELITAIYHRFVIFEPVFKEIGTGAATTTQGYSYFTADFAANNGYGTGLANNALVVWPFNGQSAVPRNFFSNTESPDPVPDRNEVGYPISVHANIDARIAVQSFTVRPRGGSVLAVRLLTQATDSNTQASSAAIVPLAPLAANTVYEVSFSGSVNANALTRNWTFTTR